MSSIDRKSGISSLLITYLSKIVTDICPKAQNIWYNKEKTIWRFFVRISDITKIKENDCIKKAYYFSNNDGGVKNIANLYINEKDKIYDFGGQSFFVFRKNNPLCD